MLPDYEKLGVFYLGKQKDSGSLLLYDSKDLVTHAVCVGMTGSGKTGLCIGLLEEAAIDGIPAIVIDPKGDLSNLLLTFPDLSAEEFAPWINADDARTQGLDVNAFAAKEAAAWKAGLATWQEDGARIQRLKDAADFRIYTPGSDAGLPISILKSFAAPPDAITADRELYRDRITATASSLLGLMGINADPLQSREHVLISNILDKSWSAGKDLDLPGLIGQIQSPPFTTVGVMDVNAFYPEKDRFQLVMSLNNLLASPGFELWMQGDALDIGQILHSPTGKPRVSIFSIAHLSDAERMFFVSLLLNQTLGWVRSQSGTTSLRALLYMDEIFGYFPPIANPPSKKPLLTLLKQARAFGFGVVLATQNPVDIDYKGLSNTGTWFIGRLQTDRDKMRVLDGLEGAAADTGTQFDRASMDTLISGLGQRVFLMNNVHEHGPVLMETRWTLSYLRGPLARPEIKRLMDPIKTAAPQPTQAPAKAGGGQAPILPPQITQYFMPSRAKSPSYQPTLIGSAKVQFVNDDAGVRETRATICFTPLIDGPVAADWDSAKTTDADFDVWDLEKAPADGAAFAPLPTAAAKAANYATFESNFSAWLFRTKTMNILCSPSTGVYSNPDEKDTEFRVRLQQAAREQRDQIASALRDKYKPQFDRLQTRLQSAEQAVAKQSNQYSNQKINAAISVGAAVASELFSSFLGRKAISVTNMNKAVSAVRAVNRARAQDTNVDIANDTVGSVQQQIDALQKQFDADVAAQQNKVDPLTEQFEKISIRPKKSDITVELVALAWYAPE
ncbi:MAG TPA: hypothetical protein VGL53_28325 [Bryobacteraceae bacterium]|jgi:hypothetical protein